MAKVIIPLEKLPYPGNNGKHKVRFRITTKDYNEISEWSPVFLLDSIGQVVQAGASAQYSYNISTSTSGRKMIDLSWIDPHSEVDQNTHDIFIKWDYLADFEYFGKATGNYARIIAPLLASTVVLKVQLPAYPSPPIQSNLFKIFETPTITL
jgi:hypothetical protein